jgi:type II secretory pathway component GspD/PulD (secretin)
MLLQSEDLAALDELEYLLNDLAPPQEEFTVFELKNSQASLVVFNLEEYFEEELKGQTDSQYSMWGEYMGKKQRDTGPISLSKRPLLRFIYDIDTNTIVAQNANADQLRTIQQLIDIYDRPVDEDSVMSRRTEAIEIRYSKAADIANAVKEVYRDLLSSKDKEFQGKEGQGKSRSETYYRFYGSGPSDDKKKPSAVKVAFEGALSIGVDELSNTLIISAQDDVWLDVHNLILSLDQAALPKTVVQVHEVRGAVKPTDLQKALASALGTPWIGGKPQQATSANGGKGKEDKSPPEGGRGKQADNKDSNS